MNQINQNNQPALARLMVGQWKKGAIPPKWDGKAAARIGEDLERVLARNSESSNTIA